MAIFPLYCFQFIANEKIDSYQSLLGLTISIALLYFMAGPTPSHSAPTSTIPTVQMGNLIWDQIEMNIANVKMYAFSVGFVSAAEKKGGGLSYEGSFVQKPG